MARNVTLQLLRGTLANAPVLHDGEMYLATDRNVLLVGFGGHVLSAALSLVGSAAFIGQDTTTQGAWHGVYGADGYAINSDATSLPSYAQFSTSALSFIWEQPSTDVRALQNHNNSSRQATTWYNNPSFSMAVNLTDGNTHRVSVYCLDWDSSGGVRSQTVQVNDANSGMLLDTRTLSSFTTGTYLSWNITGSVVISATKLSGSNAVISGVFFG